MKHRGLSDPPDWILKLLIMGVLLCLAVPVVFAEGPDPDHLHIPEIIVEDPDPINSTNGLSDGPDPTDVAKCEVTRTTPTEGGTFVATLEIPCSIVDDPEPLVERERRQRMRALRKLSVTNSGVVVPLGMTKSGNPRHVVKPVNNGYLLFGTCDTTADCEDEARIACEGAGYTGVDSETVELVLETSCSGRCTGSCTIAGCSWAIFDCSPPEPPEGDGDDPNE